MELFLLSVAIVVGYRWMQKRLHRNDDSLGPVLGEATEYDECPVCGTPNSQSPRGRGEVITRGGSWVVRQYHVCRTCDTRALWHRRLDLWVWTVFRSGVAR